MTEYDRHLLNPTETLRSFLPIYIELFVNYYGEENRKLIEDRLNNIFFVGTMNPGTLSTRARIARDNEIKPLLERMLERYNIEPTKDNIRTYFYNVTSSSSIRFTPFGGYEAYLDELSKSPEQRLHEFKESAVGFFKKFYPSITIENYDEVVKREDFIKLFSSTSGYFRDSVDTYMDSNNADFMLNRLRRDAVKALQQLYPDLTEENIDERQLSGKLDRFSNLKENLNKLRKDIDKVTDFLKPYTDYVSRHEKLEKDINLKYAKQLVKEFPELFPEGYLDDNNIDYVIFNSILRTPSAIDAFSRKSDDILANPDSPYYEVEDIEKKRVRYFNKLGIDHGEDYVYDYLSDPKVVELLSSGRFHELYISKRDAALHADNEYYSNDESYIKNKKDYDALGLVCDNIYTISTLMNGGTFISPNLKKVGGELIPHTLVNICFDYSVDNLDEAIIHELNHAVEVALVGIDDEEVRFICGWDTANQEIHSSSDLVEYEGIDHKQDGMELFNEIINELIAQDIAEDMVSKGLTLFCEPSKCKIKNTTSYEKNVQFVKEFFITFKEDILKSRKENNIQHIFDVVGEENMRALNDICNEYYFSVSDFEHHAIVRDLNNNMDNEGTRKIKEYYKRSKMIVQKMQEYKNNKVVM